MPLGPVSNVGGGAFWAIKLPPLPTVAGWSQIQRWVSSFYTEVVLSIHINKVLAMAGRLSPQEFNSVKPGTAVADSATKTRV